MSSQPLKEFPAFYATRNFLIFSAKVASSIRPESDESSPHPCKCLRKSSCIDLQDKQNGYVLRDPGAITSRVKNFSLQYSFPTGSGAHAAPDPGRTEFLFAEQRGMNRDTEQSPLFSAEN
jgi:hypothetical protein